MNRAFLHLCYDLTHNEDVKNKFKDPRADIQYLSESADLNVLSKNFHTLSLPDYITKNDSILNRIISRTWGNIRTRNALSILEIVGMEVVLGR
jgi:two-component sensor histidine kinase